MIASYKIKSIAPADGLVAVYKSPDGEPNKYVYEVLICWAHVEWVATGKQDMVGFVDRGEIIPAYNPIDKEEQLGFVGYITFAAAPFVFGELSLYGEFGELQKDYEETEEGKND